jgi:SAM-dependent methyltransferase
MNRKARRTGLKSKNFAVDAAPGEAAIAGWMAQATAHHQRGQPETARDFCDRILACAPSHVNALNLLGLLHQASGRAKLAAKALAKAIASDPLNAACHYNLARALLALGRENEAAINFRRAIALGKRLKNTETLIFENPAVTTCVDHIEQRWPFPVKAGELFARYSLETIASDIFLRCALEIEPLRHAPLEKLLTLIRSVLLRSAVANFAANDSAIARLSSAIAQQCFINEYVYAQGEEETRQSGQLRDLLLQKLADGDAIPPLLLAAVASYFPLHSLPAARRFLDRDWPEISADLVRQQVREPLEEAEDRQSVRILTAVDDSVSLKVMQQYEENPYPRWTIAPVVLIADDRDAANDMAPPAKEILIAGCGSGQHAVEVAQYRPDAQVLAIDISLPSLAYARRKTREAGLHNIDYAQADLLKLSTIGRNFDRIEAVGVLHHLAEPEPGWRMLLSLLRPKGEMRIGLYSETARRAVVDVRRLIAERGYRPTPEDIRKCRHEIMRDYDERGWRRVIEAADFYSMSGCRDLLFHVMEHRFTIPRIKAFLSEHGLSFLGFYLDPLTIERFQKQFPGSAALADLDKWHAFETENPQTFWHMYVFKTRKD